MKRRMKNKINRVVICVLVLALIVPLTFPVYAETGQNNIESDSEEQKEIIYIDSVQDFLTFTMNCSLDTWSQGKQVVLRADLSLEDSGFLSVPTFGGVFDGQGHTISGLSVTDGVTPAGLFGILQETAVVKNLNVSGDITPTGDAKIVGGIVGENYGALENCTFTGSVSGDSNIGGIAGINAETGKIRSCSVSGVIDGDSATGGIVGYNMGEISSCQNNAYINIASVDPSLSPDDINFDFLTDVSKRYTLDTSMSSSDTGGIAGYSTGFLLKCVNNGTVGYQHIGYNVGGIAGRSCGYLYGCVNNAYVFGRKDVGGIVGQMEPYIANNLTEDTLTLLQDQMDELNSMISQTLNDANNSAGSITSRLNRMADYLDSASDATRDIKTNGSISGNVVNNIDTDQIRELINSLPDVDTDEDMSDTQEPYVDLPDIQVSEGELPSEEDIRDVIETLPDTGTDIDTSEIQTPDVDVNDNSSTDNGIDVEISSQSPDGEISSSAQITMNTSLNRLSASVSGMSGQMRLLNGEISGTSGTLTDDLKEINDQVNAISDTLFQAVFDVEEGTGDDILTDTSEENIDAVTYGKVEAGRNSGSVNGDINVGGITGTMAIEYELDPEDDLASSLSAKKQQELELKAIIQKCVNTGRVISKRSYAGSVCGQMDLGLITDCEAYGDTESENADYVGGIAGRAGGSIRNCYAKCTLKGKNYVGGIVGCGVSEDVSGASSSVTGCYALVDIPEYEQYAGGIAGADEGEFSGNYYVADNLAAMNRMSYSGKAEPIAYSDLLNVEGLPSEFKHLTLRFVADGETLKTVTFDYGDSLDQDVYPELPQKDGCYAQWDTKELKNLRFDTVVTAEYSSYTSTLSDEQQREDGRPIFLIEGLFEDGETAVITAQAQTPSALGVIPESFEEAVKGYFSFLVNHKLPKKTISREIVEQWRIEIPEDGLTSHTVRYLSPDGKTDNLDIYMEQDGEWNKVKSEAIGSYLAFEVVGKNVEIAVIKKTPVWWIWIPILAVLFLLLILIVRRIHRIRKRITARIKKIPEKEISSSETQEPDRCNISEEEKERKPKKSRKKKKGRIFLLILIFICCAAAGILLIFWYHMRDGMEAYRLINDYANQQELSMELNIQADIGSQKADIEAQVDRTEHNGQKITCIQQSGISLYYSDKTIYLENGRAFRVNSLFPDYTDLLGETAALYQSVSIAESEDEEGKVYTIITEGENAKTVMETLVPSAADSLSDAQVIRIDLKEKDQELTKIVFSANGTLDNDAKTGISVEAELFVQDRENRTVKIPEKVQTAIDNGETADTEVLTEDFFRLLSAWEEVLQRDVLSAKMDLAADCGPLVVNDSMQMFRTTTDGQKINCIRKSGHSVYFTDEAICRQNGEAADQEDENLADSAELLKIAYQACMKGDFRCSKSDGGYIYTMTLDQDGMETVAYAIAPEAKNLNITLGTGSIQITVSGETLKNIHFTCNGNVKVVAVDVAVSMSGNLLIDDEDAVIDYSVPESVIRSLKQGKED